MRLFIALPIAEAVADELTALVKRLQRPDDNLRWTARESWHVTLQFLGSTSPPRYECLLHSLSTVVSSPMIIRLGELGFFERAGVFHVAVQPTPELLTIQQRVLDATAPCGFVAEARPYSPHITLARNRGRGAGVRNLKLHAGSAPAFSSFTAYEFLLYESLLHSAGSRYEVRARFPLRS